MNFFTTMGIEYTWLRQYATQEW